MSPETYVISGMILFGVGLITIAWRLIRGWADLIGENERLKKEMQYQDMAAFNTRATFIRQTQEMQHHVGELQSYINGLEEWIGIGTAHEDASEVGATAILSDVHEDPATRGRHARKEVS